MSVPKPDRLEFRRQFILGPRPVAEFPHWRSCSIGPNLVVQVHEDLPLLQIEHAGIRLTLLGYVLDPQAPEHDDELILRKLAKRSLGAPEAPRAAAELSGRWVMIADDGTDRILFHDPCGLRTVFHTTQDCSETWCASQPDRIATHLGFEIGATQREFMESPYFRESVEPWMPSPSTLYREVHHLTPNHYVDLQSRSVHRYWPHDPLKRLGLEPGAQLASELLRENVRAASIRFPLALPLTAGLDSRTILAATRNVEDIWHFTLLWEGLTRDSADLRVPARVLRCLGRKHHLIKCPGEMSEEFARIYLANTTLASAPVGAIAEGLMAGFAHERVPLSGHCSEVVRDTFKVTHRRDPDARALANLTRMGGTPRAIEQIDAWLEKVRPATERTGTRVWELFFMEHEYGVWAANGQSQWDLVHERMTPFNHRGILATLMGVDPEFRQPPTYDAYRRMMEILWPEVLSEPFNQEERSLPIRAREICRKLQRLGLKGAIRSGAHKLLGPGQSRSSDRCPRSVSNE